MMRTMPSSLGRVKTRWRLVGGSGQGGFAGGTSGEGLKEQGLG